MRTAILVLSSVLTAGALAGCSSSFEQVCPAIGWVNTVEVHLDGTTSAVDRVARVELCDESGCATSTARPAEPSGSPEPDPMALYDGTNPVGAERWIVDVGMNAPEDITASAFTVDSILLGEASAPLTWTRVRGTEECGGPATAGPVTLPITG